MVLFAGGIWAWTTSGPDAVAVDDPSRVFDALSLYDAPDIPALIDAYRESPDALRNDIMFSCTTLRDATGRIAAGESDLLTEADTLFVAGFPNNISGVSNPRELATIRAEVLWELNCQPDQARLMLTVLITAAEGNEEITDVSEWISARSEDEFAEIRVAACNNETRMFDLLTELGLYDDVNIPQLVDNNGTVLALEPLIVTLAVSGSYCPTLAFG